MSETARDRTLATPRPPAPLVLVATGMSGAGRTTAINTLEDLGYEALHNFPISLVEALLEPAVGSSQPIAIGVAPKSRNFSAHAMIDLVDQLRSRWRAGSALIFLDCDDATLETRFNQTRRRHPMATEEDVATGIARERDLLRGLRDRADVIIDTAGMSPHALRAELEARFALDRSAGLSVTVQSFSYKRGTPHGADMVLDCRFLTNPYWVEHLRPLDGRDPQIQEFVRNDPLYAPFFGKLCDMLAMLLPAYRAEGKAHFTIALGCTGGRHRSVTLAEATAAHLAKGDCPVSIRHRELPGTSQGAE